MKAKILISILILILAISAVSASQENITPDELTVNEDLTIESSIDTEDEYSSENDIGTFSELSDLIWNNREEVIELDKDYINDKKYVYDNEPEISSYGIEIGWDVTIDGKGHTIDSNNLSNIFYNKDSKVTYKNIIFKNGYQQEYCGGAIRSGHNSESIIINCTFINCHSQYSGAIDCGRSSVYHDGGTAVYDGCAKCIIANSTFINCTASENGGAVSYYQNTADNNSGIINCTFINCQAKNGGAIYFYSRNKEYDYDGVGVTNLDPSDNNIIKNCNFLNCTGDYGGAIYIGLDSYNNTILNSNFINCKGNTGGAVYCNGSHDKLINSNFTSCHAKNGGAVYAENNSDLLIINCDFNKNTADELGGSIYGGINLNSSFDNPEVFKSYNPVINTDKNPIIDSYPISINIQNATGNFSVYLSHNNKNYTLVDCVNITDGKAVVYYNYTQLGTYNIKTISNTNYGVYESNTQSIVSSIKFLPEFDYNDYHTYTAILTLPNDAKGNFSIYYSTDSKKYKLYKSINITNETEIEFKAFKEGNQWIKAVCNSNYGLSNITSKLNFKDKSKIYAYDATIFSCDDSKYSAGIYPYGFIATDDTPVSIKINNIVLKTKTKDGEASVKIPKLKPGTYTASIEFKNNFKTVKLSRQLTVKHIITLKKVTVKKSAKKLTLTATLKKPLKNKKITFKFNNKKYTAKTNKKGTAKITIKRSALNKLKTGKKITYTATYQKDTVKKTVKVKN